MANSEKNNKEAKKQRGWMRLYIRLASIFFLVTLAIGLSGGFFLMVILNRGLPSLQSLKHYRPKMVTQVFSQQGEVIGEFFQERRIVADEIPDRIKLAFIAAEDSKFYSHK